MQPSLNDIGYYKAFVVLAILGGSATPAGQRAISIFRERREEIKAVASFLQTLLPLPTTTLYRGLLIDPQYVRQIGNTWIPREYNFGEFASFTESRQVACWFGNPDSQINEGCHHPIYGAPNLEGWVAEYTPDSDEIIFSHRWIPVLEAFPPDWESLFEELESVIKVPRERIHREVAHHFSAQQEVLLRKGIQLTVTPIIDFGCPDVEVLDDLFML